MNEKTQNKSKGALSKETEIANKETLLEYNLNIIKKERMNAYLFFAVFFIIYSFLFGLWKIPLINFGIDRMSQVTFTDFLFLLAASLLVSILVVLWQYERKTSIKSNTSVGAVGGGLGILAGVCPACQGIVIVALGSTLLNIPTPSLIPFLGLIQIISICALILALYLKMDNIYNKTCKACVTHFSKKTKNKETLFENTYVLGLITVVILILFTNQLMIPKAFAISSPMTGGTVNLGSFEYGSKITLKPMPLAVGEQPKISGYGSIVKPLPTISELPVVPSTGDAVQDLVNNVVPTGTPWYGEQAGVSFDDPVRAATRGSGWLLYTPESLQFTSAERERLNRITNSFTCDYCCGSPQRPTRITQCGCAHAQAAKGIATWFVKYYGDSYSDEEIYGEMARWYALWYPKGTIERIIQEAQ